jgi:hypothetical protein
MDKWLKDKPTEHDAIVNLDQLNTLIEESENA